MDYRSLVNSITHGNRMDSVVAIDLETLIDTPADFLTGERIIAVSISYFDISELRTEVLIAKDNTTDEEDRILKEFDRKMRDLNPSIIIGYNHSGYDVPLIRIKMNRRSYSKQLWNLKRILSTSYLLDMMYVIADDLYEFDGDYRLRKLSEVVIHPRYQDLKLQRSKYLTKREGMPVNKAIELMWKEEPNNFREYCSGDTKDLMSIFTYIFLNKP
jgi:DNA polymerase elongation subunit (family B)